MMTVFMKNAAVAFLAVFAFGAGCRTFDVHDAHNAHDRNGGANPPQADARPLSLSEVLTPEQLKEAEAWSEYAMGILLIEGDGDKADVEAASQHFSRALALMPDSEEIAKKLLEPFFVSNDFKGALAVLEPVVQANPTAVSCNIVYCMVLDRLARQDEATLKLKQLWDANGQQDLRIARLLLSHYMAADRLEDAGTLFASLMKRPECRTDISLNAAYVLFWNERGKRLSKPDNPGYKPVTPENDAEIRRDKYRFSEDVCRIRARKLAEKLITLKIEEIEDATMVCDVLTNNHFDDLLKPFVARLESLPSFKDTVGFCLIKLKMLKDTRDKALPSYLKSLLSENNLHPMLLQQLLVALNEMGEYAMAMEVCERLIAVNPRDGNMRLMMANLCLITGKFDKGLSYLLPMTNPGFSTCAIMATLWRRKGNLKEALNCLNKAEQIALKSGNKKFIDINFLFDFAIVCEGTGDIPAALERARQAYELDKDSPLVCNFYGYMLADHDSKLELADKLIAQALAKEPENAAYLDSMAWVRFKLKKNADALKYILKSIACDGITDDREGVIASHAAEICAANNLTLFAEHFRVVATQINPDSMKKHDAPSVPTPPVPSSVPHP